ncbi:MAG: tetratricopeptide repeat protein [Candidatus Omnitrophica bacterium]|nr:tetratricopeptide repeat protein [Candidatus Omnitrophota bacterium]MBU4590160.1 tetratricopeptide repeat protein [Candidatus Omnitrophota bacterium]
MNRLNTLFILIIILATIAAYANSLHNQFVWDDEDWILKNSTIKNPQEWSKLFTENSIQGARKGSNFYRPLQAITHGVDYLLWGYRLPGHHATNIAFHALAAIVLFLLLGRVFSQNMAFLAALFFAIHPVHTEAVTYVSGRADPMAVLFMLLTVLLFEKNIFLACGAFILGILSKESALIAPLLICVYLAARDKKIDYKKFTPFIFIIIVYAALRLTILNFTGTIPENAPKAFFYVPFYIRLSTFLKTLPVYFKVLLWPFGLHMERDIALSYSVFEPQSFLGLLTTGSLFFFGFRFRKSHKFLLFSAAWFFICIFPNSNLFPINALLYEHWLYLPSIGFFVIVAWAINRLLGKRQLKFIAVLLALCLAGFYTWRTFERNKDWHDPISFYESTIMYKPDSARLHNNLAMAYADAGRNDDAIREYKKAIESGDYYAQPHYNISNIYLNRGDYASAVKELKISIEIDNNFLYSHESLALIYFNQNNFEQAKKEALFIIEREPQNKIAREILSKIPYLTK